jgi:triosephosphate isomerase
MKKLVIFNWKMNPPTRTAAVRLARNICRLRNTRRNVFVAPPAVYLSLLAPLQRGALAAQNVAAEKEGAFTGEISAPMLKSVGVRYCIVGHSERRYLFGESDALIARKVSALGSVGITPVLCVGERRRSSFVSARRAVIQQLQKSLAGTGLKKQLVVAYEPVWAIGGDKKTNVGHTRRVIAAIRRWLSENGWLKAAVLYGGSVSAKNVGAFARESGTDGFLVGSASLRLPDVKRIIKAVLEGG